LCPHQRSLLLLLLRRQRLLLLPTLTVLTQLLARHSVAQWLP
jgi:hypothetical protein